MTDIIELLSIRDKVVTDQLSVGTTSTAELGHISAGTGDDAFLKLQMGSANAGANLSGIRFSNSSATNIFQALFDNATEEFIIESDLTADAFVMDRSTGNISTKGYHAFNTSLNSWASFNSVLDLGSETAIASTDQGVSVYSNA